MSSGNRADRSLRWRDHNRAPHAGSCAPEPEPIAERLGLLAVLDVNQEINQLGVFNANDTFDGRTWSPRGREVAEEFRRHTPGTMGTVNPPGMSGDCLKRSAQPAAGLYCERRTLLPDRPVERHRSTRRADGG